MYMYMCVYSMLSGEHVHVHVCIHSMLSGEHVHVCIQHVVR